MLNRMRPGDVRPGTPTKHQAPTNQPPTTNQPPPTTNHENQPTTTNHQPPKPTNHHQPTTNNQPPPTIHHQPNHHPPTSNQPPPTHQPTTTNHHEPPTTTKCLLLCPVKLLTCGVIRSYNCALRCLNLCMVRLREPVAWGEEACWCKFGVLLGRLAAPTMLKVTVLYLVCCTLCNCVCDVAVPCGFARPQWEVR